MDEAQDEVAAKIAAAVALTRLGDALAAEGLTTVALDDDGRLVEHRPDGTSSVLDGTHGSS
jgi:hypothetical protein